MFAKEAKNRFYSLPKELIIYIYLFDNTYKTLYNQCMHEMVKMFQINRINDRIVSEKNIYEIYLNRHDQTSIFGKNCEFSKYILRRIRQWGDQMPNTRLKYHHLIKLN
jgi:hypothetical protein